MTNRADIEREIEDSRIAQRYHEKRAKHYRHSIWLTEQERQEFSAEQEQRAAKFRAEADAMEEGLLARFRKGIFG